ncbi:hypothetical protein CAC42_4146 [Sphaceloma murrayae]|uniref:Uncharacterized protein n=1 Tax=Sphaceloma murrayae TaxID=2082308 RepID=A0A2K1QKL0_9PEZI|nr:hypothetical protein CAC42_4146 [Sphaceloma murrayae]
MADDDSTQKPKEDSTPCVIRLTEKSKMTSSTPPEAEKSTEQTCEKDKGLTMLELTLLLWSN